MLGEDEFNICRSGVGPGVALTALPSVAALATTKQPLGSKPPLSCQVHPPPRNLLLQGHIPVVLKSFHLLQIAQLTF